MAMARFCSTTLTADNNVVRVPLDLSHANFQVSITPEPSSIVLGLIGAIGLCSVAIRKRRARRSA